jgi:hypothetical protein
MGDCSPGCNRYCHTIQPTAQGSSWRGNRLMHVLAENRAHLDAPCVDQLGSKLNAGDAGTAGGLEDRSLRCWHCWSARGRARRRSSWTRGCSLPWNRPDRCTRSTSAKTDDLCATGESGLGTTGTSSRCVSGDPDSEQSDSALQDWPCAYIARGAHISHSRAQLTHHAAKGVMADEKLLARQSRRFYSPSLLTEA